MSKIPLQDLFDKSFAAFEKAIPKYIKGKGTESGEWDIKTILDNVAPDLIPEIIKYIAGSMDKFQELLHLVPTRERVSKRRLVPNSLTKDVPLSDNEKFFISVMYDRLVIQTVVFVVKVDLEKKMPIPPRYRDDIRHVNITVNSFDNRAFFGLLEEWFPYLESLHIVSTMGKMDTSMFPYMKNLRTLQIDGVTFAKSNIIKQYETYSAETLPMELSSRNVPLSAICPIIDMKNFPELVAFGMDSIAFFPTFKNEKLSKLVSCDLVQDFVLDTPFKTDALYLDGFMYPQKQMTKIAIWSDGIVPTPRFDCNIFEAHSLYALTLSTNALESKIKITRLYAETEMPLINTENLIQYDIEDVILEAKYSTTIIPQLMYDIADYNLNNKKGICKRIIVKHLDDSGPYLWNVRGRLWVLEKYQDLKMSGKGGKSDKKIQSEMQSVSKNMYVWDLNSGEIMKQ